MEPAWRIRVDGTIARWGSLIERLRIGDEIGTSSDTLEISLPDPDGRYAAPRRGVRLEVEIGFAGRLAKAGQFVVSSVDVEGPPPRFRIKARGIDFVSEGLKLQRTRSFPDHPTLGSVARKVAVDHGLTALIDDDLDELDLVHVDQRGESDAQLLMRLARRHDAVYKHADGRLLLARRETAASLLSGHRLQHARIRAGAVLEWGVKYAERPVIESVEATFQDPAAGGTGLVASGSGDRVHRIPRLYPNREAAAAAAAAHLASSERAAATLRLVVVGDPYLSAGRPVTVTGVHSSIEGGGWTAQRVVHVIDRGGFRSEVEATPEKPPSVVEAPTPS